MVAGALVGFAVASWIFVGYCMTIEGAPQNSDLLFQVTLSASFVGAVIGGILGVKWWWQTLVASVVVVLASRVIAFYIVS